MKTAGSISLTLQLTGLFLISGCVPIDFIFHGTNSKYDATIVPEETVKIHSSLFIGDMHADSLLFGRDLNKHSCLAHIDFPRLQIANMGLQILTIVSEVRVFGCDVLWFTDGQPSPMARTIQQAENLQRFVNDNGSAFLLRKKADLQTFLEKNYTSDNGTYRRIENQKQTAILLGIEGAQMLRPENLEHDFKKLTTDLNVRLIGLAHQFDNAYAGSSQGKEKGGLTDAGRTLIRLMVANGVILDLAHSSGETIKSVLEMRAEEEWNKPLLVSHTGLSEHVEHKRNITDEQAVAIARTDGVIGIMFWDKAVRDRKENKRLDINSTVDAILYLHDLLKRKGIENPYDHIGIGSDYDGFIAAPFAVDKLSILTSTLLEREVPEPEIRKIMGGNVLRVISAWLQ